MLQHATDEKYNFGVCVCVCVFVSSCQATKVLISKYLATRRVVVSVGGVNRSERQLLTSLIQAS